MKTYIFVALPSSGHINAMLKIAWELKGKGNRILFATLNKTEIISRLEREGFQVLIVPMSYTAVGYLLLPLTKGYVETYFAASLFFSSMKHYTNKTIRLIDEHKPDCIISDFAFPGAYIAAEIKEIPFAILYHAGLAYAGPGIPPFASGLPIGKEWGYKGKLLKYFYDRMEKRFQYKMNRVRSYFSLASKKSSLSSGLYSPWLTLVLTSEISEAPRYNLPASTFFVGPCVEIEKNAEFDVSRLKKEKIIYVSLGTFFNNKPGVLKKIINALSPESWDVVISCGKSYKKLNKIKFSENIHIYESVPQMQILSIADAVITHGGNNTINETLWSGKPMLVMPVGGEQMDNAEKIVYLQTGLRADIAKASPDEIYSKVSQLINNITFKRNAEIISRELSKTNGILTSVKMLEYLAEEKKPVVRPGNYPLTVQFGQTFPWEA